MTIISDFVLQSANCERVWVLCISNLTKDESWSICICKQARMLYRTVCQSRRDRLKGHYNTTSDKTLLIVVDVKVGTAPDNKDRYAHRNTRNPLSEASIVANFFADWTNCLFCLLLAGKQWFWQFYIKVPYSGAANPLLFFLIIFTMSVNGKDQLHLYRGAKLLLIVICAANTKWTYQTDAARPK